MASLRERARKQRPSLRTGERLDSVAESVVNHSVSPAAPADSILPADTLTDSEILALDSMPPTPRKSRIVREKVDIDNAVDFAAKDSLVMMGQNAAFMYGASNVKYADIDLSADEIHMDMKESLVYAVGRKDTTDEVVGSPVFKDRSGEYQSKTMTYNFKTSKGFITDVVTQQGEGYLTGGQTKKLADDSYNIINGRYTTCDDHEHPHFYMQLTKAKMRPKKDIVTGPAYMVLCDVPLPLAVPFGYFPFTSKYSSGVIFPTFGDDYNKGFYLRDGGYYFALSDYADLALTGEIYTKGSWGLAARSTYRKRYKFSGSFNMSFLTTITRQGFARLYEAEKLPHRMDPLAGLKGEPENDVLVERELRNQRILAQRPQQLLQRVVYRKHEKQYGEPLIPFLFKVPDVDNGVAGTAHSGLNPLGVVSKLHPVAVADSAVQAQTRGRSRALV